MNRDENMNAEEFNTIVNDTLLKCTETLCSKSKEYSTDKDKLHNFKTAAQIQNITPIQALAGMMCKHTVSVYDMCQGGTYSADMWDEKIGDSINYLLLLRALVQDNETY